MKTPTPELRDLLDRLMDEGGLSRPEMGRLEELMSDPEVMEYCCEALLNESLLAEVESLLDAHTGAPQFGLFGQPRVNVLELNLALDGIGQPGTERATPGRSPD